MYLPSPMHICTPTGFFRFFSFFQKSSSNNDNNRQAETSKKEKKYVDRALCTAFRNSEWAHISVHSYSSRFLMLFTAAVSLLSPQKRRKDEGNVQSGIWMRTTHTYIDMCMLPPFWLFFFKPIERLFLKEKKRKEEKPFLIVIIIFCS